MLQWSQRQRCPPSASRSAGQDVGDGTPVRGQHRRAMGRQVVVREPAEDVSELDHGRSPRSQAGHQLVEDALSEARVGSVRWV